MRFLVSRTSQGAVSQQPPCRGAIRGPEAAAWPGEYQWFVELGSLEELIAFLHENGGGLGIIRPLCEQLPSPTGRIFPRIPRTKTLHKDIKRAKIARIDPEGRCLDLHSLRYFFCTLCARHLPIQVVRLLMRHKDIRQTVNLYMDLGLTDVSEAVIQLPNLLPKLSS